MVVKLTDVPETYIAKFENGVILYGSQTYVDEVYVSFRFENGVILYGSQTYIGTIRYVTGFENGVILYGSQTEPNLVTLKVNV